VALFRDVALAFVPAALTAALAAGIAGCGSSGGTGPLASASATEIISEAMSNTTAAQSFTISGSPTASLAVDLTIVRGVGCTGTIVQGATKSTLIWTGTTVYAHSDGMPANEWKRATSSDSNVAGLIALCTPSSILAPLSASAFSNATRTATMFNGQPALAFALNGTGQGRTTGSVVVTDSASPVLLSITGAGSAGLTFTAYGATRTIAPPAAS
jgi:hypothetical protein